MPKTGKILIVDDDQLVLDALEQAFLDEYDIVLASSGQEALDKVKSDNDIDAIILDIRMAEMDGLETAGHINEINSKVPIIFHTGYPGDFSENEIDESHKPFDYVVKNERPLRLHRTVRNAVAQKKMGSNSQILARLARDEFCMIGKSKKMLEIYEIIERIAPTDNKVIILGPTGSGKELVARAIHRRSCRADKRLGIYNCNHKAPDLVESELFGHIRGAFTGAIDDKIGLFEYADGGTVFLDEIGDLDSTNQNKFLRVLESGEIQRLGSPEIIKVNIRLICATHRNIEQMVKDGSFREDLFYRLGRTNITLPSLKDRSEDIPDLINYFLTNLAVEKGYGYKYFEKSAIDFFAACNWSGNVRQLSETIESLYALSPSSFISKNEVAAYLDLHGDGIIWQTISDGSKSFQARVKDFKKLLIAQALVRNNNVVKAAAEELSLDPSNLSKMIKEAGIKMG